MRYTEKFEADKGFRLSRDEVSILVQAMSFGRRLTDEQLSAYVGAVGRYLDGVGGLTPRSYDHRQALTTANFPNYPNGPFFKYVEDETWSFISRGSFLLGSPQFYRNIQRASSRDSAEGAGAFHLAFGDNQLHVSIMAGFNTFILCGTGTAENRETMSAKFGRTLLRIDPLEDFIRYVGNKIGSSRVRVHDMIYTDIKNFTAEVDGIDLFHDFIGLGDMSLETLHEINERFFEMFYDFGFTPSMLSKPLAFSDERERRVVYEMDADIERQTMIIEDQGLTRLIQVVD